MRFSFQTWCCLLSYCRYIISRCMIFAFVRTSYVRRHSGSLFRFSERNSDTLWFVKFIKTWMPLRIRLTNIYFYTSGTLFPKVDFKDLQFPYCPVLPSTVLCICAVVFYVNMVQTEGFQTKEKTINPFQSNFSANRILPSSYLFWAGKRLVD
jgi:hypothetical protein